MNGSDFILRMVRESMYAEAYAEACAEFWIVKAWRDYKPTPGETITIRRLTRTTEARQ